MSRWATVLLLLAAIGVMACVVVFLSLKGGGGKAVGGALFAFDPDDITQIKITNGDKVMEFRRTDDGWQLGPEPKDRASVDVVRRLIDTAMRTPVLDRIQAREIEDRDKLSTYGLKKSRIQFDFKGDRDLPLLIGKNAADESRLYVRFEDSRDIYLIPDALVNLILASPQDFRDRRPLRLHPDRVDHVKITRPVGEVELKRDASGWQILKPLTAPASGPAVESLVADLLRLGIEGFETTADPGAMGFSEPIAEVRLYGEGEDTPETIRVGKSAPGGGVYARLEPRGITVRLPQSVQDILSVDLATLRDNSLLRVNLDLVDMIRVDTGTSRFEIKRRGDGWGIGDKPVSEAAIQKMVDALAAAKAARFEPSTVNGIEKAGLSEPVLNVEFYSVVSENTPETTAGNQLVTGLKFGSKPEAGLVPVLRADSSEIARVPGEILRAIPTEESSWLSP